MTARNVAVVAGLLLLAAFVEGKDLQLASAWAPAPVKVDGTADTWAALLKPLGDEPMVIGVQNDASFLYLCIKTSDLKTKKQIEMLGLTVWANGEGKDKKAFGVRFPVGGRPRQTRPEGSPQGKWPADGPPGAPSGGDQPPPPAGEEIRPAGAVQRPTGFELIGPTEDDRFRVPAGSDELVATALGDDSGVMVIEFRIPLKPTDAHPLAIGAVPGATIAVGLETEKPKRTEAQGEKGSAPPGGEPGGGPPGGGHGGPGGGYGGGRAGMGGGFGGGRHGAGGGTHEGMRETASPIKMWLRVTLAAPPTPLAAK